MSRVRDRVRGLAAAAAMGALVSAWPAVASAAQARGDSPDARKRQAVEMCARELRNRARGRDVRVDRTIRSDYRGDRVTWNGYMSVQRSGPDLSVRVACTVAFDEQEPDHQLPDLRRWWRLGRRRRCREPRLLA